MTGAPRFAALLRHGLVLFALYRAHIYVWMLTGTLPLVVMLLWLEIAEALPSGVLGADYVLVYFATVFLVRQATPMWVAGDLEAEIGRDELGARQLRPGGPIAVHATRHLAGAAIRLTPTLAIWLLIVVLGGAAGSVAWERLPIFLAALAAAWTLLFALMVALGSLAFWIGRVQAPVALAGALALVLGGAVVPLDLLPEGLRAVAAVTPFPSAVAFPASIPYAGTGWDDIGRGAAIQAAWLVALAGIAVGLWRRGTARHLKRGGS